MAVIKSCLNILDKIGVFSIFGMILIPIGAVLQFSIPLYQQVMNKTEFLTMNSGISIKYFY